ncbi:MAG: Septum site-determining protein MinD [Bacteroidetes bacterium ADurb.Bin408]|nr:MAG: Septum site-determining protein MinD [Bacteroidetes bacterium ADurb.Bin408]
MVASGKGGVGKSTVSANVAAALARKGFKTALVDADIFGPSIPKMLGVEDYAPEVVNKEGKDMMYPAEKHGIKIMSIGFFIARNQGLIWRGPMASGALQQLFENTIWGDIDYMVIDFPPGTSDIQLTTVQKLRISGALIVTTPQEIALNDARKAANMFSNKGISVPILGVVENMSWFTPKSHPDEKYYLFGRGGGALLAQELNTRLLAFIPLVAEVGEAADKGINVFAQNLMAIGEIFEQIADSIIH